jgi:CysZ protein
MNGIDCFVEGLRLVRKPGLRRFVIIPMLISIVVLTVMIAISVSQFSGWVGSITGMLPDWLGFLSGLIWLLAVLIVAFTLLYLFTIVANIIASPFNALLSIKVEELLVGKPQGTTGSIWLIFPRALWRETSKLSYLLPRLLGLLLLGIIPVINAAAPVLWILFGAWMMAIQYADYAADNNEISFAELRERLARKRMQSILFGLPAYLLLAIPLVNLVLMPVCVAGGTVFWVYNLGNYPRDSLPR